MTREEKAEAVEKAARALLAQLHEREEGAYFLLHPLTAALDAKVEEAPEQDEEDALLSAAMDSLDPATERSTEGLCGCGGPTVNEDGARCASQHPDGRDRCDRAKWHSGPHMAHDSEGCAVWPAPASPPRRERHEPNQGAR